MDVWSAQQDTGTVAPLGHWRPWLGFLRHVGEMILAMMLGMALLGIPYGAVMGAIGYAHPTQQLPEHSALVMTINMTLPMVLWMRYRGHQWGRAAEMGGAMVVPALSLTLLCVVGVIPHGTLSGAVMIVMLPAMLAVMLYRRAEYVHRAEQPQITAGPPASHPVKPSTRTHN